MSPKVKAHIAFLISGIIFGANYSISKGLMPVYCSPLQIIFLRVAMAVLLYTIFHKLFVKEKVEKKDYLSLALCGLFGVAINQIMFFEGLNLTTPVNASVIHATNPISVFIFAIIILKEKLTPYKIFGIILGALGTISIIVYDKHISFLSGTFTGNIFILINTTSYALYLVLVKKLMDKYNALTVIKWIFIFGFIMILPFTVSGVKDINWNIFTPHVWLSLFYVIIINTFIAYLLTTYSLKYLEASVAGFYIYIQPVVAALIALFTEPEDITAVKIISVSVIFIGFYFINKKVNK